MSSSTYNSILLKSSSKNMGILLISLESGLFCYTVLKLKAFTHFASHIYICFILY